MGRRQVIVGTALGATAVLGATAAVRRRRAAGERHEPLGHHPLELPPARDHEVPVSDGARISLSDMGSGDAGTVVLIHGWVNERGVWSTVARRLVEGGHRVIAYDQRGHGRSELGAAPCTINRLGDDLHEVLEHLDVRDVTIAGHSMGGMAAQAMLIDHRHELARVRAVVLVATGAAGIGLPPYARTMADAVIGWRRGDALMARRAVGTAVVRSAFGRSPRPEHVLATRDMLLRTPVETRRRFMHAISDMDLRHGLPHVGVPTAVIVGSRDTLTPPARAHHIARSIPGARLEQLPGRGHMLPFEAPHEVSHLIAVMAKTA